MQLLEPRVGSTSIPSFWSLRDILHKQNWLTYHDRSFGQIIESENPHEGLLRALWGLLPRPESAPAPRNCLPKSWAPNVGSHIRVTPQLQQSPGLNRRVDSSPHFGRLFSSNWGLLGRSCWDYCAAAASLIARQPPS